MKTIVKKQKGYRAAVPKPPVKNPSAPAPVFTKRVMWVEKVRKSEIFVCLCGNKYIKTRKGQEVCIWCIYKKVEKK